MKLHITCPYVPRLYAMSIEAHCRKKKFFKKKVLLKHSVLQLIRVTCLWCEGSGRAPPRNLKILDLRQNRG